MAEKVAIEKVNNLGKYALNPPGNLWLNDGNKFAVKLMSQMGWSPGKGLGRNEDGIVENIKVKTTRRNAGVGWNENSAISITAQSEEFESILSQLNEGHLPTKNSKHVLNGNDNRSLEHRSQKFRKRLHYQKLIRGKDVSRYSDDDIKSIFILKKSPDKSMVPEELNDVNSKAMNGHKGNLNITEYFAKKMQEKLRTIALQTSSLGSKGQGVALLSIAETKEDDELKVEEKKLSKKKRKRSKNETSDSFQGEELYCQGEILNPSKKMKKKSNKSTKSHKLKGLYTSLKSCLKSKQSVDFVKKKEVTFNETVSYRIIKSEFNDSESDMCNFESTDSEKCQSENMLSIEQELAPANIKVEQEITDINVEAEQEPSVVNNEARTVNMIIEQELAPVNIKVEKEITAVNIEAEQEPSVVHNEARTGNMILDDRLEKFECFNIPKNGSSNYNSWIDSQRQALKMNAYKNTIKKIRNHPILKTTNLLQIKGYGNWGF